MKTQKLHETLIQAGRKLPDDERVPYAFEKRIMAHLTSAPQPDQWALWARGLWRATVPCLTLMCGIALWSTFATSSTAVAENPLDVDLELAMLQPFEELSVEELW